MDDPQPIVVMDSSESRETGRKKGLQGQSQRRTPVATQERLFEEEGAADMDMAAVQGASRDRRASPLDLRFIGVQMKLQRSWS